MRFARNRAGLPAAPISPGERLVRRTGLGLALFTLALMAILMAAVGFVTAAATVETANQSVDRNLRAAAANMLLALQESPSPTPEPTETASPDDDDDSNSGRGSSSDDGDRTPRPVVTPSPGPTASPRPAPTPSSTPDDDRPPESSDTFFLVLDAAGDVVGNPQRVPLDGLPVVEAVAAAAGGEEDWRTIEAGGHRIRLFSQPIGDEDETRGVLQAGFVLTFQDEQTAQLVRTIVIAMLIGLLGTGLVTLFVTRRAMSPIRAAFEAERRFVAAASHELRTPVAVVRASAEILQREDLIKPQGRRLVADVVSESDRLGRLVGDLLALASAEAGQIAIDPVDFDMRALVDEVVGRVAGLAAGREVRVESAREDELAPEADGLVVHADRERMLQLLTIFIDNAIEHSPPNGVVRVVARAADEGSRRRVVVDVLDQGPGVPVQERDRIFEPFAKVGGRRRTSGSTGLGLAIARILAARQEATLSVGDAPGGGARFSVSLARRPASAVTDSSPPG